MAHLINSSPINPEHLVSTKSQPTHLVAYKETREGLYGPYEVEVTEKAPEVRGTPALTSSVLRILAIQHAALLLVFVCANGVLCTLFFLEGRRGAQQRLAWLLYEGEKEGRGEERRGEERRDERAQLWLRAGGNTSFLFLVPTRKGNGGVMHRSRGSGGGGRGEKARARACLALSPGRVWAGVGGATLYRCRPSWTVYFGRERSGHPC